jgi:hypothetical protein
MYALALRGILGELSSVCYMLLIDTVFQVLAKCSFPGAQLVYSVDGSRPTPSSPLWPASGTLTLPARTVAVNVKALPAATPQNSPVTFVESPTTVVLVSA